MRSRFFSGLETDLPTEQDVSGSWSEASRQAAARRIGKDGAREVGVPGYCFSDAPFCDAVSAAAAFSSSEIRALLSCSSFVSRFSSSSKDL